MCIPSPRSNTLTLVVVDSARQVLSLNDQLMLDPFSLTDFASVVDASAIEVRVHQGDGHPRK